MIDLNEIESWNQGIVENSNYIESLRAGFDDLNKMLFPSDSATSVDSKEFDVIDELYAWVI